MQAIMAMSFFAFQQAVDLSRRGPLQVLRDTGGSSVDTFIVQGGVPSPVLLVMGGCQLVIEDMDTDYCMSTSEVAAGGPSSSDGHRCSRRYTPCSISCLPRVSALPNKFEMAITPSRGVECCPPKRRVAHASQVPNDKGGQWRSPNHMQRSKWSSV